MLKTRIVSAVIGLLILIAAVFISKETLAIAIFVLSVGAVHEFYNAVAKAGHKPVKWLGYLASAGIILLGFTGRLDYFFSFMILIMLLSFSILVFSRLKVGIIDVSLTICGIFYTIIMLTFIVMTRELKDGIYFVWIIFIGAWATDTFAYFGGRIFGRIKLSPVISPHKTVEGAICGVIGSVGALSLYGYFLINRLGYIPYFHFILIGIISGIISQIGDLTASAIKRNAGIKDYGSVIPGHGGVLDRFDSVLLVSPVIYLYLYFFI